MSEHDAAGRGPGGGVDDDTVVGGRAVPDEFDPMADTLHPAMALNTPTGSFGDHPVPRVQPGDVHAGRYRLEQQLAQRGGTLTWRAFDQKLSRSVLVHILGADDPRTPDVLEAARKAAFATDSRFLRVLDAVSEQDDQPALVVCEFAPGESLERLLQQGPLSALEAAWVAREVADALAVMHSEGLFHQRINPDTVIITATGNVKIVGFLIEAAMYPDAEDGTLAWSQREQADVVAIGKLLYASLVARWPTARDQLVDEAGQPRATWGLRPAPMDEHGWLTPRQLRSGVSPALDVICDQVLSSSPRHGEPPLRTANQVVLALGKVLGSADAAADLERRMRYPLTPAPQEDTEPGTRPALAETTTRLQPVPPQPPAPAGRGGHDGGFETAALAGTAAAGVAGAVAAAGVPRSPQTPPAPDDQPTTVTARVPGSDDERPARRRGTARPVRTPASNRPRPRRWLALLLLLLALVVLVGTVRALTRDRSGTAAEQGGDTLPVASAQAFDPTADGGNGQENSEQAALATDQNPQTAWKTVVYLNDPRLGRLKPGVGLVLDLGEVRRVSAVRATLVGQGTDVQLRVPNDAGVQQAPGSSAKQWRTVASATKASGEVELKPTEAVESRFVLVYLTSLPKVSGNRYQGGVAEVVALS